MESSQSITLRIRARGIRILFLVSNRQEAFKVIKFYTHIWCGAGNSILPIPQDENEMSYFEDALRTLNPDYIYYFREEDLPTFIQETLKRHPAIMRCLNEESIENHIDGYWMRLSGSPLAQLSHMVPFLRSRGEIEPGNIFHVKLSGLYRDFLTVQAGFPGEKYEQYLTRWHNAEILPAPTDYESYLKTCLFLARAYCPATLTILMTAPTTNLLSGYELSGIDNSLLLFLDDGEELDSLVAFWNTRGSSGRNNRLLLPKREFEENLSLTLSTLQEAYSGFLRLWIVSLMNRESAEEMCNLIQQEAQRLNLDVKAKCAYRDFKFDCSQEALYAYREETVTQAVNTDGSVRLGIKPPIYHENTEFAFAFDAILELPTRWRYVLPCRLSMSHLLSNSLETIEWVEKKDQDVRWLRTQNYVRPSSNGVVGITRPGHEVRIYIHPDEVVISRLLKEDGFSLRPTPPTRYAKGFIRKCGGIFKALRLLREGGADVIRLLRQFETSEVGGQGRITGTVWPRIIELLVGRGYNQEDARSKVKIALPDLLRAGLVRRGFDLQCSECSLKTWYAVDEVDELVECKGCAESFQWALKKPDFSFRTNELAARFVGSGGDAVLMTVATLYGFHFSSVFQLGGELIKEGKIQGEADLFWLAPELFALAECKSHYRVDDEIAVQMEKSLTETIQMAKQLRADVVFLGITVVEGGDKVVELVSDISSRLTEHDSSLHLIMNDQLYLHGNQQVDRATQDALKRSRKPYREWTVGEFKNAVPVANPPLNHDVLDRWHSELKDSSPPEGGGDDGPPGGGG